MIYDCFPFCKELMMLELRLNALSPVVDKFVLVEATHTYSGYKKRLYYDEVKDSKVFAPFKDKIIHIIFDEQPESLPIPARVRRYFETKQKNIAEQGFADAKPDDIIIVSDVDEIINPKVFPLMELIFVPCKLKMKMFYYYFNNKINRPWMWPAFCRFKDYQTAQVLRLGGDYHKNIIVNAGWHFSDVMTPDEIVTKIGSICHTEYDTDYFKDADRVRKCIEANEDVYERAGVSFTIEPLEAPDYLMNNTEKYKEFIKCSN